MSVRIPARIYRNRHGTFYFRHVIPADLRNILQRREVRLSLGTEQRQQAVAASLPIIAQIPALLAHIRDMTANNETEEAKRHYQNWLAEVRRGYQLRERIEELESALTEAKQQLARSVSKDTAQGVVKRAWTEGQLKGRKTLEERLMFPWLPERTAPISELLAAFLSALDARAVGASKAPPTPKTRNAYEAAISEFIYIMGDMRIGNIDRRVADEFSVKLHKLPANRNKSPAYRGKSAEELLAMAPPPQAVVSASGKVERISMMFEWALREKRTWGIDANPFKGRGQKKKSAGKRRPFTLEEMHALLSHRNYKEGSFPHSYAYWLIPLGTFTGARLGELCWLDLKDFVKYDGIPCIDINDEEADKNSQEATASKKRVKNENAKRLIPIHPQLIEMGLLRYVETLRARGETHLFPELNRENRDGPGHAASKWFGRHREKAGVGVGTKQEAVFHSFRHLFITTLLDAGVAPHTVAPIVGHETGIITGDVYWSKKDARKRLATVERFILPDSLLKMFPAIESVTFRPAPGPKPGAAKQPAARQRA